MKLRTGLKEKGKGPLWDLLHLGDSVTSQQLQL